MEFGWRLRESAEQGKMDKVLRELEAGTPVDCTSYSSGRSALHLASGGGHVEIVKLLIERGANVEAKDAAGETPLHVAVAKGRAACVAELLRSGADAWAHKNAQGKVRRGKSRTLFSRLTPLVSQTAYAQAQELGKESEDGKQVLRAFSDVYDMGGSEKADPSKPPRWTPDDHVNECSACKDAFSLVRRKHHCRACGGIFCAKCSSGAVALPKFDIQKSVRVCDTCFASVVAESGGGDKVVSARSPRGQSPPPGGGVRSKERKDRSKSRGKNKDEQAQ